MRIHDETAGERARETSDASESRRWLMNRDEPEPYGLWFHAALAVAIIALLILLARAS